MDKKLYVRISFKNPSDAEIFIEKVKKTFYGNRRYLEMYMGKDNVFVTMWKMTENELDGLYENPYWQTKYRSFKWAEKKEDLTIFANEHYARYNTTM